MSDEVDKADPWDSELFVLSGSDRDELASRIRQLQAAIADHADARLVDLAAAVNHELDDVAEGVRIGIVTRSFEQLSGHLRRAAEKIRDPKCWRIREATGLYFAAQPLRPTGGLAFLFPGEGAQFTGMLAGLPAAFSAVKEIFSRCEQLASSEGGPGVGLLQRMLEPPASETMGRSWTTATGDFSSNIFSVAIADWVFGELADHFGIVPDAVAGHSAGELSALCHVGVIESDEELIQMAKATYSIDQSVARHQDPAALLALGASREVAESIVAAATLPKSDNGDPTAYVAMDNCPHQTVIVGLPAAIEIIENELKQKNWIYERLELDRPYHTCLFEPFMPPLREMIRSLHMELPRHKTYSCTTGLPFPNDTDAIRKLAVDHWVSTVEFSKLIRQMHDDGIRVFLEVGPRGNLSAFVEDILRGKPAAVIPLNVPRISPLSQINHALAQLVVQGVPVNVNRLYTGREVRPVAWRPATAERSTECSVPSTQSSSRLPRYAASRPGDASKPAAVLGKYQTVMQEFLQTQQDVMSAYLSRRSSPRRNSRRRVTRRARVVLARTEHHAAALPSTPSPPASPRNTDLPLLGQIVEHVAGQRLVMRRRLELCADPYADHHTVGGQRISRVDPNQHGLPVMPMTFTFETMAEAASKLLPDLVVVGLREVRLQKWLAFYVEDPVSIELTAEVVRPADIPKPIQSTLTRDQVVVQVKIRDLGNSGSGPGAEGGEAAMGQIILAPSRPMAPTREPFKLTHPRSCRVSLQYLYDNLFHGPLFQGVQSLDQYGDHEIIGTVDVLPRAGLFAENDSPTFLLDPVTLDTTMHPLAAWHLEQPDQSGRIMLPFALDRIDFYAPCPQIGERFTCLGRLRKETPRYVVQDLDVVDAEGGLRWRMSGIRLWRFYLPFDGVNFHGPKDVYFLSKEWSAAAPDGADAACVRFDAPADLLQPAILWAASKVILSPREQQAFAALAASAADKAAWMFSRAACKDATRKLFMRGSDDRMFVADIEVDDTRAGRWRTYPRDPESTRTFPRVAVARENGHFVAVATDRDFPAVALSTLDTDGLPELTAEEMRLVQDRLGDGPFDRLRVRTAKRLAAALEGQAVTANSVVDVSRQGQVTVRLNGGMTLAVTTAHADQLVAATTIVEEFSSRELL